EAVGRGPVAGGRVQPREVAHSAVVPQRKGRGRAGQRRVFGLQGFVLRAGLGVASGPEAGGCAHVPDEAVGGVALQEVRRNAFRFGEASVIHVDPEQGGQQHVPQGRRGVGGAREGPRVKGRFAHEGDFLQQAASVVVEKHQARAGLGGEDGGPARLRRVRRPFELRACRQRQGGGADRVAAHGG